MSHWEKKIRHFFTFFDTDKNGFLSERDFDLWTDRLIQAFPSATEGQKQEFRQTRRDTWIKFVNCGKTPAKGAVVTPEQFVENVRVHAKDPIGLRGLLDYLIKPAFAGLHTNKDGFMDKKEFAQVELLLPSHSADVADMSFDAIDTNGDGLITVDELIDSLVFFFTDEKDSSNPTNAMFGKPVE